jgi:glutathione S-transferase
MAGEGELVLYADMASQPCRAVIAFLKLAHIPFTLRLLSIRRQEHKKLTQNLLGSLPYIEEKGIGLSESHAIFAYLLLTRRCADHWLPSDPKAHALCQQYLHWHHTNLRNLGFYLFWSLAAHQMGMKAPAGTAEEHLRKGREALSKLNSWLAAQPYIAGSELSIADLSAVCEIAQLQLVPDLLPRTLAELPHVSRWFERVYNIPEVKDTHSVLEGISAKVRARL